MNQFTPEKRWNLFEILFQNKVHCSEIARKCIKCCCRERPILPGICEFIAKVRENGFFVDALRRKCDVVCILPKISKLFF